MYRENPLLLQLVSFVLAIGLHAALLFGHFSLQSSTIGDEGVGTVDLAPGPPGENSGELAEPPPPPPPPPGESLPEPPAEEAMAREPQPDDIPEPDAEVKKEEQPRINVQYESPAYSTNKNMTAEEIERSIRFLLEHGRPGTGQVGSKPGGGGGGSGRRYGDIICKKCPYPAYPYEARKMHQAGTTVVRVLIGVDGRVQLIVVQESSGYTLLDQQAVRFLRKWEFEPIKFAGIPVTASVDIPLVWKLVDASAAGEEPAPPTPLGDDATGPAPPPQ